MYYVYILKRPDGTPFYVGKGKGKRWKEHEKRALNKSAANNPHCRNVICKILREGGRVYADLYLLVEESLAFIAERFMIADLRKTYKLTNITDGGEGPFGHKHTRKTKRLISLKKKGQKLGPMPLWLREKIGRAHLGKKASVSARRKMSLAKIRNPIMAFLNYKKTPADKERWRSTYMANLHLWAKKRSQVQIEWHAKRRAKGLLHPRAKITPKKVVSLRRLREVKKLSFDKLAEKFNISATLAKQIVKRQAWSHVQ